MYSRILLLSDGSAGDEVGLTAAASIAEAFRSSVQVLVAYRWPVMAEEFVVEMLREAGDIEAELKARASSAVEFLRKRGLDATSTIRYGSETEAVLQVAAAWGADLIVLPGCEAGPVKCRVVGCTSCRVANRAEASVLVAR